jgi:hypothetical protein
LLALALVFVGCRRYVPADLPLAESIESAGTQARQDTTWRTIDAAYPTGEELRVTLNDGSRLVMRSLRVSGDSLTGRYRTDSEWTRASIPLYQVRTVEREEVDYLATVSLITVPITLALLITD